MYRLEKQPLIEKGESRDIKLEIPNVKDNELVILVVKYKDILNNWYKQIIILSIVKTIDDKEKINFSVIEEELLANK